MEDIKRPLNFDNICRTCLKSAKKLDSLLECNKEENSIVVKLSQVANLQINTSPEYPNNICSGCRANIIKFYDFRLTCQKSEKIIIEHLESKLAEKYKEPPNELPMSNNTKTEKSNNNENDTNDFLLSEKYDTESSESEIEENNEFVASRQGLKLKQFDPQEVEKVIAETKARFNSQIKCIVCSFQTANSRALSVHMTRIHKDAKKLWCVHCNNFFADIEKHNATEHTNDMKCPFCPKTGLNMGHFVEHVMGHSGEKKYACPACDKCFVSARKLRVHKETHVGSFMCAKCSLRFTSRRSLQQHVRTGKNCQDIKEEDVLDKGKLAQLEPQNFCKLCNKKVRSLDRHMETAHAKTEFKEDARKHLCPFCGKQFTAPAKLNIHIRVHTGEMPYKCRFCDKRARTRTIISTHERTHTGEKPYICSDCGKGFSQSSILNTHRRLHTGRPVQCTVCTQRFCRPSELKIHMRKHTGEKPYHCKECNQSFRQKSHLIDHSKTHSAERPHMCRYCDKSFRQFSTLKTHLHIHLGLKPYKCPQCPYACRQSFSMTKHMKRHIMKKFEKDAKYVCNICQKTYKTEAQFVMHYNKSHGEITMGDAQNNMESITLYSGDAGISEEITNIKTLVNVQDVDYVDNLILCSANDVDIDCPDNIEILCEAEDKNIEIIYGTL